MRARRPGGSGTTARVALALALALAAGGCIEDVEGLDIPCAGDPNCPTGWFCSDGSCHRQTASHFPVALTFDGAGRAEDALGGVVEAPAGERSSFFVGFTNTGGEEAAYPEVTFSAAECLGIDATIPSNLIWILRPGDAYRDTIAVDPDPGCPSPVTATVHMAVAGREFTGTFQVVLVP